jgi:eukaryotic-like serine/threonine-protein kinase
MRLTHQPRKTSLYLLDYFIILFAFSACSYCYALADASFPLINAAAHPLTISNFLTYVNPQDGFKIQYPSNWEKIEFSRGIVEENRSILVNFISPLEDASDVFREYFIIEKGNLSSHLSVKQYVDRHINTKKTLPNFKLIESSPILVAGKPAYKIVFTYSNPEVGTSKTMEILAASADKIYLLSFNADVQKYSDYLLAIDRMIKSFQLKSI